MKKTVFTIILSSTLLITSNAQIFSNKNPINKYFLNIEYAHLPEPEKNKSGMILYTCDSAFINIFLRNQVSYIINELNSDLYKKKFRKSKYRYRNYVIHFNAINYTSQHAFTKLSNSINFEIVATKFKRKFKLRQFKLVNDSLSTDIIYNGEIQSSCQFEFGKGKLDKKLSFDSASLTITNSITRETKVKTLNEIPSHIKFLEFNFDDYLVRVCSIEDSIDSSIIYIKPGKEIRNIVFYLPVKIIPMLKYPTK
jgi:hypothetical protein